MVGAPHVGEPLAVGADFARADVIRQSSLPYDCSRVDVPNLQLALLLLRVDRRAGHQPAAVGTEAQRKDNGPGVERLGPGAACQVPHEEISLVVGRSKLGAVAGGGQGRHHAVVHGVEGGEVTAVLDADSRQFPARAGVGRPAHENRQHHVTVPQKYHRSKLRLPGDQGGFLRAVGFLIRAVQDGRLPLAAPPQRGHPDRVR